MIGKKDPESTIPHGEAEKIIQCNKRMFLFEVWTVLLNGPMRFYGLFFAFFVCR